MTQRTYRTLLTSVTVLAMAVLSLLMLDRPALADDVAPPSSRAGVPAAKAGAATFATFRGEWTGHTRGLRIRKGHVARERISIGCCDKIADVTFEVARVRGTTRHGSIRATLTKIRHFAESADRPAPEVGDVVRFRLRRGILTEPASGTFYCNDKRGREGTCGA